MRFLLLLTISLSLQASPSLSLSFSTTFVSSLVHYEQMRTRKSTNCEMREIFFVVGVHQSEIFHFFFVLFFFFVSTGGASVYGVDVPSDCVASDDVQANAVFVWHGEWGLVLLLLLLLCVSMKTERGGCCTHARAPTRFLECVKQVVHSHSLFLSFSLSYSCDFFSVSQKSALENFFFLLLVPVH